MNIELQREALQRDGVILLHTWFSNETLMRLKIAAEACFGAIASAPDRYRFTPFSHSVVISALLDFGVSRATELTALVTDDNLSQLLTDAIGEPAVTNINESWVRK